MNTEAIQLWLKRKKSSGVTARCLTAFAALLGGAFILVLTFWFGYVMVWMVMRGASAAVTLAGGHHLRLTHEWRLILSAVFVAFLFVIHFRTSQWHWGQYGRVNSDLAWSARSHFGPFAALLTSPTASTNMIGDILMSGPRLVTGSWKLWRESRRLGAVDEAGCAQLIAFLLSRAGAVPYEELREAGWEEWFGQLRSVDGVIFLEKGLSLSGELRQELQQLSTA